MKSLIVLVLVLCLIVSPTIADWPKPWEVSNEDMLINTENKHYFGNELSFKDSKIWKCVYNNGSGAAVSISYPGPPTPSWKPPTPLTKPPSLTPMKSLPPLPRPPKMSPSPPPPPPRAPKMSPPSPKPSSPPPQAPKMSPPPPKPSRPPPTPKPSRPPPTPSTKPPPLTPKISPPPPPRAPKMYPPPSKPSSPPPKAPKMSPPPPKLSRPPPTPKVSPPPHKPSPPRLTPKKSLPPRPTKPTRKPTMPSTPVYRYQNRWGHFKSCKTEFGPLAICKQQIEVSYYTKGFRVSDYCCNLIVNMRQECTDVILGFYTDPFFVPLVRYTCHVRN